MIVLIFIKSIYKMFTARIPVRVLQLKLVIKYPK